MILLTLMALSVLFYSCAYFNTLYNARRAYKEAEESRATGSESRQLKDKYQDVVKKCANLLSDYPNSRWVDDALFLMGKALVRQGDLNNGIRKFIELMTNFPESDYIPASSYWLALAYSEKKEYNQALAYIDRFLESYPKHDLRYQVMFLAGDINIELEDSEKALNFYSMVAEQSSDREAIDEAVLKSARLFYKLEDWEKSAANYSKALRKGLPLDRRHEISIALGDCYNRIGKCREAMEIFDKLLEEATTTKEKPPLMLGRASSFVCMDSLDKAISSYETVTKDFPKSTYSAEAFYRMGMIYHEKMDSLEKAQVAFSKVRGEYANSEFASMSLEKGNSLKRLIELQKSVGEGETQEQAAEKKFLTAEIQFTRLDEIEMAVQNYRTVVDSFPETSVAPKAAYALAYIYHHKLGDKAKAVELYRELAALFPRSPQARGAVDQLGTLGAEELREKMEAFVDSALADTTALAEERRRQQERADSALVDTTAAGTVPGELMGAPADSALSDTTVADERRKPAKAAGVPADTLSIPRPDTSSSIPPEDRKSMNLEEPADTLLGASKKSRGSTPADSLGSRKEKD